MELYNKSMDILIKYHKLSLTDSIIVGLMKTNNIIEIASFDGDFDKIDGIMRIY
jgi:predicted nucleic acid-binding protein